MAAYQDDRLQEKMRPCLGPCRQMFLSRNAGHRFCPSCAAKPVAYGLRRVPFDLDTFPDERTHPDDDFT